MSTTAYDRFRATEDGLILTLEDGDYLATCFFSAGSWSWVVWGEGLALAGRRSWNLDAFEACAAACVAIARRKGGDLP
jgi:hypothetical protein